MARQIHTRRDVWIFAGAMTLLAIICSELGMAVLYIVAGPGAFHMKNSLLMAAILPLVIAFPITYYVARISFALAVNQQELRRLADTDPLTRLPNRRSFFQDAAAVLTEATEPASMLVLDADHFKELNDSYGHATGDKALIAIADILRANFRKTDLICRVGGEEFAVLLPGMDISQAEKMATRVVSKVAASPLSEPGAIIEYSVSCGVADTNSSTNLHELFKAADDAMYLAKKQGRNRVTLQRQAA